MVVKIELHNSNHNEGVCAAAVPGALLMYVSLSDTPGKPANDKATNCKCFFESKLAAALVNI